MAATAMQNVAIPIDLSAFALTRSCAENGASRIGPITQPNYIGLRLDEALMEHDLTDHIDFHLTTPPESNTRLYDIGVRPPQLRRSRMGVYLHWSLPRCYRSGKARGQAPVARSDKQVDDLSSPIFPTVPNRWLVVRRLTHQVSDDGLKLPDIQTWIVESNRVTKVKDVSEEADLEVDFSPFLRDDNDPDKTDILEKQAEIFIGRRNEYSGWPAETPPKTLWIESETGVAGDLDFLDLTVLGSSNPLFPDYVPHNGSVFSIVDCFKYKGSKGETRYLKEADADYFVIGWHSIPKNDILGGGKKVALSTTLNDLKLALDVDKLKLPDGDKEIISNVLGLKQDSRAVLHGSIYTVKFRIDSKPRSLADEAADKFGPTFNIEPLSVGATALDAVITFLRAHTAAEVNTLLDDKTNLSGDVASLVLRLMDLLYAADDSYNERVKAQDINMYQAPFAKSTGSGFQWIFAQKTDAEQERKPPSESQWAALTELNDKQPRLNAMERKLLQRRWDLFAQWWKYCSDKSNVKDQIQTDYLTRVQDLNTEILDLEARTASLRSDLDNASKDQPFKKVIQGAFYMRNEPTLCIAGIDSGWPADFMDLLAVRVDQQLPPAQDTTVATVFAGKTSPVPTEVQSTAHRILVECLSLKVDDLSGTQFKKGFQAWGNANPFAPMFVEWEAIYYHIDRAKWTVGVRSSPFGIPHSQVRYGIDKLLSPDTENQKDFRYLSGRALILPQPVFSLESIVKSVIDSHDPSIDLTQADIDKLVGNIRRLKFISSPLSGVTEGLLTRVMGAHVKPTITYPGKTNIVLPPAVTAAAGIGITENILKLVDTKSDLTPYGNLLNFPDDHYPRAPFKGVTHGQLMLTKLNIVDRFGQAIALPTPKPRKRIPAQPPESVSPCLSQFVAPDIVGGHLNTVFAGPDPKPGVFPDCPFIQLPPSINQNARINASFLNRSSTPNFPFWKETENDKPESPIFGWIVINYQDYGLQFFRPDGRFYREVRDGGAAGTTPGTKWLPFDPPKDSKQTGDAQLDGLITQLKDKKFLRSFFYMINNAISTMLYPPSDYSNYANSLVGKPLALVNIGWSLDLALPALTHQNTLGNVPTNEEQELFLYQFSFKIGDVDRPFDGVVGYWETNNIDDGKTTWDTVFTYFADPENTNYKTIRPDNFPVLHPKYVDPVKLQATGSDRSFRTYREARAAQYYITTMLIDPYTPVHAYSPILPIQSLSLPPWTIQQAFTRMTAFFRLGPSLLSADVQHKYPAGNHLDPESWATKPGDEEANPNAALPAVRLPISGKKGLWRWLQPYDLAGEHPGDDNVTRFVQMDVNEEDTKIRKYAPPYTFVEGYLQLARPLLSEEVKNLADR